VTQTRRDRLTKVRLPSRHLADPVMAMVNSSGVINVTPQRLENQIG
jgi:hypothetical protein